MTVLIPEGAFVGQGAISDSNVVVIVVGGERSTIVVSHGVTWENNDSKPPQSASIYLLCLKPKRLNQDKQSDVVTSVICCYLPAVPLYSPM